MLQSAAFTYSRARSLFFLTQFSLLNAVSHLVPFTRAPLADLTPDLLKALEKDLLDLLKRDAAHIAEGTYPMTVLRPESPLRHLRRVPSLVWDGISVYRRRASGRATDFGRANREFLKELPRYYRRNFHFQTEGYLSDRSASLYEHQVEMLFSGTADAMRRLVLPPLRKQFGNSDGQGLTFLEVAAGTGRTSHFVRLAFPKAKIIVSDLSEPYLKVAREKLGRSRRFDFVQSPAERLPFQSGHFDAVYSVFLFHELPHDVREQVFAETARVLRPGGRMVVVDSLQKGDSPELDPLLETFPKNYHEPYYRNYTEHPLQDYFKQSGMIQVAADRGFFSKVVSGSKLSG